MLESEAQPKDVPQRKNTNNSQSDNHDSNLLDHGHIESDMYERNRNYYVPSEPLGIKYFDKIYYIFQYGETPVYIHITLPIYIISTLIFSVFHSQPLSWFTLILLLLISHMLFISLQICFSLYIAHKFDTNIYRILIWPYGFIGYASDYKQWTHFVMVEYAAPLVHIVLFILFWGIAAILGVANWGYSYPINVYFGQNLLNGIWVINIILASLHICIPVYSMKTARLWVTYLYRKRTHREVAQLIILPSGFMTIILLIFGIVDARPLPLFLSLWTIYQTYLLYDGNRKNLVAKLPLFQLLEETLRHKRGRKKKSMDVGQKNKKAILDDLESNTQNNTQQNVQQNIQPDVQQDVSLVVGNKNMNSKVEDAQNRKKMGTVDENEECEPKIKNTDVINEPIQVTQETQETQIIHQNDNDNDNENEKKDVSVTVKNETEQKEQKEQDLLNIDKMAMAMDSSDSSEKHVVVVNVEKTEQKDSKNVQDLLNMNVKVNTNENKLTSPNEMIAGDSAVMVSGVSVGSDYEIVDTNQSNSDKSPKSDHDFVDVTND